MGTGYEDDHQWCQIWSLEAPQWKEASLQWIQDTESKRGEGLFLVGSSWNYGDFLIKIV